MKTFIQICIVFCLFTVLASSIAFTQPGAFNLVFPANGAWASARPYFDWETSTSAVRYQLYIDGVLRKDSIATSYYQFPSSDSLTEALHWWYVIAVDGSGNTTQSSETRSVRIDATPPNTFDLVSPSDMQWTAQLRPTFQWTASSDAGGGLAKYQLWIDGYLNRDNISASSTSTTPFSDLTNGSHTWFIKAIDYVGNERKSNQTWIVKVDNVPPIGSSNYSLYFDGVNDYATVPHNSSLNFTGGVTLEAWVNIPSYSNHSSVVTKGNASPSYSLRQQENGKINFTAGSGSGVNGTSTIPLNTWTHIAVTYSGYYVYFYMNGYYQGYASYQKTVNNNTDLLYIGVDPPFAVEYWKGEIDEVRIWNYVRTSSQIAADKNRMLSGNETGLVGYWRFNEGSGTTIFDQSVNGNNGTLKNGAYFKTASIPGTNVGTVVGLKLPTHNQYIATNTPTFSWETAIDTGIGFQKYQLWIDGTLRNDNLTDTSLTISIPLSYGRHTWYVKAFDQLGNNQSSAMNVFYVDIAPPNPFSLNSPSDSEIVNLPTPNFSWQSTSDSTGGSGLSKYQLWVDGVVNRDSIPIGTTTAAPSVPLSESPHTWFVKAYDKVGNVRQSAQTRTVFVDFNPPTPFDLISPTNDETVFVSRPVFKWHSSTDVGSGLICYELYISGKSTVVIAPTDTSVLSPYVLQNGSYTWYITAVDWGGAQRNSNQTNWRVVINVIPPSAPSLLSPINDTINQPINLSLNWSASEGAESYRLQVSTDSLFGSFVVNDSTLINTTKQIGPLLNKTKYHWRVNAKNTGGTSDWSEVRRFTTIVAKPLSPNLVFPNNGATNQPTTLSLRWNTAADAETYRFQMSMNAGFTSIVYDDSTQIDTLQQVGPLLNNTLYYWRVSAKNVGGTSAYSAYRSFTTIVVVPTIPALVSPLNGATNQPTTLTVSWNASTGATSYRLQLSIDSLFGSTLLDDSSITSTSRQVGPLSNDTKYYWRVRAKNIGGVSDWSAKWNFTTIVQLPNQVVLIQPLNGATVNTDSVNCVWQRNTPAITAYWYERANDSLFTINRMIDSLLIDTSYITRNLVTSQSYWWKVRAKNAAGWGSFSTKRKFNALFVAVRDEKGLPDKFSLEQNYPNPFNPISVIHYELPEKSHVMLKVYNLLGQEIVTLVNEEQPAGYYNKQFDAQGLPSGIYIYRIITSSGFNDTRKMLLLR